MALVHYFPQNEPLIKEESGTSRSWFSGPARDLCLPVWASTDTHRGDKPTVSGERTQRPWHAVCGAWVHLDAGTQAFYFQLERLLCLDPSRIRSEMHHGKHCEGACSLLGVPGKYRSLFFNVIPMKASKLTNIVD